MQLSLIRRLLLLLVGAWAILVPGDHYADWFFGSAFIELNVMSPLGAWAQSAYYYTRLKVLEELKQNYQYNSV